MLDDRWKGFIKQTVYKYLPADYKVFIFGSRARGTNRKYSDVDIGLKGPQKISLKTIFRLKEEFFDSNIPYMVDVADFSGEETSFKKLAVKNVVYL